MIVCIFVTYAFSAIQTMTQQNSFHMRIAHIVKQFNEVHGTLKRAKTPSIDISNKSDQVTHKIALTLSTEKFLEDIQNIESIDWENTTRTQLSDTIKQTIKYCIQFNTANQLFAVQNTQLEREKLYLFFKNSEKVSAIAMYQQIELVTHLEIINT
jgi:hypothetical protein